MQKSRFVQNDSGVGMSEQQWIMKAALLNKIYMIVLV